MKALKFIFPFFLLFSVQTISQGKINSGTPSEDIKSSVKIGLLISDERSFEARNGAEMAVSEANVSGGLNGIPFGLAVRSMEGPWGTGSQQAVNLIFDEKVLAIVGSHDGRNAHLVEQVATKARIVFLSAWTGDPTLSQAFTPWFFSSVPNNNQQAEFLINEIFTKQKLSGIAVVSDNSYDSESAVKAFLSKTDAAGKKKPLIFRIDIKGSNLSDVYTELSKPDIRCIVLLAQAEVALKFLQHSEQLKLRKPVFGSLSVLGERGSAGSVRGKFENVMAVSSGNWFLQSGTEFSRKYYNKFGIMPGAVAAYTYDAVNLIIEASRISGNNREKIQKTLLNLHHKGVTGTIKFDEKGNRIGNIELVKLYYEMP